MNKFQKSSLKITFLTMLYFSFIYKGQSQNYIDTIYNIQITNDQSFGKAVNFCGKEIDLLFDVARPLGEPVPECGRPLMILVHGGGFLGGSRKDVLQQNYLRQFAKRGYVTTSIEYRLGMFQTDFFQHCNVDGINGLEWDCTNIQDTAEWYRAVYRAQQDVKGAIRYFVQHKDEYGIDPNAIFLMGESAGSFAVIHAAFTDVNADKPSQAGEITDAKPPARDYEQQCIKFYNYDVSIDSMDLKRGDLGSIDGDLYPESDNYRIRAVAGLYGGMFWDLFEHSSEDSLPAFYMFHQPNDLIVPFNRGKALDGMANFFANNFGCGPIVGRPRVSGSKAVAEIIAIKSSEGKNVPSVTTDFTNNYADAWQQFLDPSTVGHAVVDPWGKGLTLANFFATRLNNYNCNLSVKHNEISEVRLFPSIASDKTTIYFEYPGSYQLYLYNSLGVLMKSIKSNQFAFYAEIELNSINPGNYFVKVISANGQVAFGKLVVVK